MVARSSGAVFPCIIDRIAAGHQFWESRRHNAGLEHCCCVVSGWISALVGLHFRGVCSDIFNGAQRQTADTGCAVAVIKANVSRTFGEATIAILVPIIRGLRRTRQLECRGSGSLDDSCRGPEPWLGHCCRHQG